MAVPDQSEVWKIPKQTRTQQAAHIDELLEKCRKPAPPDVAQVVAITGFLSHRLWRWLSFFLRILKKREERMVKVWQNNWAVSKILIER